MYVVVRINMYNGFFIEVFIRVCARSGVSRQGFAFHAGVVSYHRDHRRRKKGAKGEGGAGPPPIILAGGGGEHTLWPIIHPHFPSISM